MFLVQSLMRLWSLHPRYLDTRGLVALWRESLLAQKVLHGLTRGYTRHPQLDRFRAHANPTAAMTAYLHVIHQEAARYGRNIRISHTTRMARRGCVAHAGTRFILILFISVICIVRNYCLCSLAITILGNYSLRFSLAC